MKKRLLILCLLLQGAFNLYSQCTAPNPPLGTSLILNASDTQLAVYFDTTNNSPATRIYYLGIISTSPTLSSGPVNGTIYNVGDNIGGGTVIFRDSNYIYKKTGLSSNTTYTVFVYAARVVCTGEPFYSTTSIAASATTFNGAPGIPTGYYDAAAGLTCTSLKTALFNIIKPTVANPNPTYTGLWSAYYISDDRLNDAANKTIVWDMYTDNPSGSECEFTFGSPYQDKGSSGGSECQRYNREHSFPQSWFAAAEPMRSDMFIVFPADKKVNGQRGNFPYGKVTSPTYTSNNGTKLGPNTFLAQYTGSAFEPINAYKGDLARSTFYVATAYEDLVAGWVGNTGANNALNGTSYPAFDNWYIQMLYQWHVQDPVSTKETDRNNDIYMIQGARNPYIDHPEYVALVWQCTGLIPVTIIDFTAQKNNESVLLKWYATFETSFKQYEIQRSTDGIQFFAIGEVTGRNLANYDFTDHHLPAAPTVFYRLRMIDIDGKSAYSKTVVLHINGSNLPVLVYPNPVAGKLTIKLQQGFTQSSGLQFTDITGRMVMQLQVYAGQKIIETDVSHLPAGRYFIQGSDGNEMINRSFVVIR